MMGIEFKGANQYLAKLRKLQTEQRKNISRVANSMGDVAQKESMDRAPILHGILTGRIEKSIQGTPENPAIVIRVPMNSPASKYAVAMHENFYNLGEGSVGKQRRAGVEVGRKYITRGLEAALPKCKIIIEKGMKK